MRAFEEVDTDFVKLHCSPLFMFLFGVPLKFLCV